MSVRRSPRLLVLGLSCLVLGVAVVVVFAIGRNGPELRPSPRDRETEPRVEVPAPDPPADADPPEVDPTAPEDEMAAWRRKTAPGFSGLVIDEAGRPVEDAVVVAYEGPRPRVSGWRPPEILARDATDTDGRFRLVLHRPSDAVVIRASKGTASSVRPAIDGRHVGMIRAGTLRLSEGLLLTGRVLGEDGRAVPGAVVLAGSRMDRADLGGETDAEGRFSFATSAQGRLRLGIGKPGYVWQGVPVPDPAPGERDLGDLVLARGAALRVRVTHQGTPWPGPLELLAYAPGGGLRIRATVPEGGVTDLFPTWPGRVNVHLIGPGELDLASAKNVDPTDGVVELVVPETVMIEGLAVDATTEEPVEVLEAGIVWGGLSFEMEQGGPLAVAMRTELFPQRGVLGTFRLPKLEFRRTSLVLKTATHGVFISPPVDLEAVPLRIPVPPPARLEVEITGAREGLAVLWQGWQATGVIATVPVREGRAIFERIPPGKGYGVEVIPASPDGARVRVGPCEARSEGTVVRVEILPAGALRGRLLDPDEKPVPWAEVVAVLGKTRIPLLTDPDGRFATDRLSPQRWGLRAKMAYLAIDVRSGETTEVELRQVRPKPAVRRTIEGRVKARGILTPFLRAWVVQRTSEQRVAFDGSFRLELFGGPAEATVLVGTERNRPLASSTIVVPENGKAVVEIEVVASTVKGRIVDAAGVPVKGAFLTGRLSPAEGHPEQILWVKAGADGRFRIPGVGTGTVELAVYRPEQVGKGALISDAGEPVATISRETTEGVLDLGDVTAR